MATRKTTQPKTAQAKPPRPPRAAKAKATEAGGDGTTSEAAEGKMMRIKDIVQAIAASSTVKRKDIRPVLDAALRVMGDALAGGATLNLPPLGKMSVKRTRSTDRSDMVVLKLRRVKPGAAKVKAAEPLADSEE